MATGLLLDPIFQEHDTGRGHPESAKRLQAVEAALTEASLVEKMKPLTFRHATEEEIEMVHDPVYVKKARKQIEAGDTMLSTGDTIVGA